MQKQYIFIFIVLVYFISGCKKDNNRIASPAYQIDSVVESRLDTAGNATYVRTMRVVADYSIYLDSSVQGINSTASGAYITFRENEDSIILESYARNYADYDLVDYIYLVNGKFIKLYDEYSQYINHEIEQGKRQYISYNSNGKLNSITTMSIDYSYGYSWYIDVYWPDTFQCRTRTKKEVIFNYAGNNLNSLDYNYYAGFSDSTAQFSVHDNLFSYTHHYPNQKELIGVDINDMILSSFLFQWIDVFRGLSGSSLSYQFYGLELPLILNKKASFNSDCNNLIEHIQFSNESVLQSYNNLGETSIQYEFDTKFNNRIKSMVIDFGPYYIKTKYLFYYKN